MENLATFTADGTDEPVVIDVNGNYFPLDDARKLVAEILRLVDLAS